MFVAHTISVGQDSGNALTVWIWLRISYKVVVKVSGGALLSEGLIETEESSSKMACSHADRLGQGVGPLHRLGECPHNMAAGLLQSK